MTKAVICAEDFQKKLIIKNPQNNLSNDDFFFRDPVYTCMCDAVKFDISFTNMK